jgi:hypothetical protein
MPAMTDETAITIGQSPRRIVCVLITEVSQGSKAAMW